MSIRNHVWFSSSAGVLLLGLASVSCKVRSVDLADLTITEILDGYEHERFTAEQVTKAYLARIEDYEPRYNAFTFLNPHALEQARAVDALRRAKGVLGPLAGVPIVVKESIDVRGFPSTAGWAPMSSLAGGVDFYPLQDADVVTRMVSAGAIVVGKTNIPAFSDDGTRVRNSWAGPTLNAIDPELAPGASSAGTATAVAAGFAAAGLAEETGGSIQNPAAAQSLVGVKPTYGLIPTRGVVPLAGSTRDVVGPIAKDVEDAALMLNVMAGYAPGHGGHTAADEHIPAGGYTSRLNHKALEHKVLGLYGPGWRTTELSEETKALYARAIEELKAEGAIVVEDPFAGSGFASLALPGEPYDFRGTESAAYDFTRYLRGLGVPSIDALSQRIGRSPFDEDGPLSWYVQALPELQRSLSNPSQPPNLAEFEALRGAYLSTFDAVVERWHLDALVFPQATEALPALASDVAISETTVSAINIAGLPGVTVPAGQYASRAPFSLIFVGKPWSEAELLGYAYDYEQATHHRVIPDLSSR